MTTFLNVLPVFQNSYFSIFLEGGGGRDPVTPKRLEMITLPDNGLKLPNT